MNNRTVARLLIRIPTAFAVSLVVFFGAGPARANPSVAASGPGTGGVPALVNFDDLSPGTAVYNQYPGVTFIYGDAGNHPIKVVQPAAGTISPANALQSQIICEICGSNLYLDFAVPQSQVRLSTGLAPGLPTNYTYAMELAGYQGSFESPGALVATSFTPCLGNGATAVNTPLEVDDPTGTIGYVRVSQVLCSDHSPGYDGQPLLIDNLGYDQPLSPPPGDHTPPVVTITSPTDGSTIDGSVPGETALTLTATINEDALYSLTAQVNGHSPVVMSYGRNGPGVYSATVYLDPSAGLVDGSNTVVVKATDFDVPQNTGTATTNFVFHTPPPPPPVTADIWPAGVTVTQSIDTGPRPLASNDYNALSADDGYDVNISNDYLVQGKSTVVRVFGAASGVAAPVPKVPAVAFVYKANCSGTCPLPGGTGMAPISNPTTPKLNGITVPIAGTDGASLVSEANTLSSSWNFLLPASWTDTSLVMYIYVNQGTYAGFPSTPRVTECQSKTSNQTCQWNNLVVLHLHFQPAQRMVVDPVVIHVTGTYKGHTYNNVQPTQGEIDNIFTTLNEMYPQQVVVGKRTDITVSPGIGADDLVDDTFSCGFLEACASVGWPLGIFPDNQGQFAANAPVSGGFIAGEARVGGAGAWADADNPEDSAHELGHNIGFDHWGCENGVTSDECGVFPIPHAGTGVWATDIANWQEIPPGNDSSNSTPHAHDFMSYGQLCSAFGGGAGCDLGEWTSWYDWSILENYATNGGYDTNDPPALVVRGTTGLHGTSFAPIYQAGIARPINLPVPQDDATAIYTLEGFDSAGNVLFTHNFEPTKVDIHNASYGRVFDFTEPVPAVAGLARVELLNGGTNLGAISDRSGGRPPTVTIQSPSKARKWKAGSTQTIRWHAVSPAGLPLKTLVQYSADGGKTYVVLAHDITAQSLKVKVAQLPGSSAAHVYVTVSDGFNSTVATSSSFRIAYKGPQVHIVSPVNGKRVLAHVPLVLQGTASDAQQTIVPDKQFHWYLDGKSAGAGSTATIPKMTVGKHSIKLVVVDNGRRKGRARVTVIAHAK